MAGKIDLSNLDAMRAAFAAKGGAVEVIAQGTRAIESDKTIYAAMREGTRAVADSVAMARNSETRFHIQQDAFHAAKLSGWTDADAADYAAHAHTEV
jgi:hypothetical protein